MSPMRAARRDDFPAPTAPTMAVRDFSLTSKLMSYRQGGLSFVQENVPLDMQRATPAAHHFRMIGI